MLNILVKSDRSVSIVVPKTQFLGILFAYFSKNVGFFVNIKNFEATLLFIQVNIGIIMLSGMLHPISVISCTKTNESSGYVLSSFVLRRHSPEYFV